MSFFSETAIWARVVFSCVNRLPRICCNWWPVVVSSFLYSPRQFLAPSAIFLVARMSASQLSGDTGLVGHLVEEAPVDFVADACEYGNGVVRYSAAKGFAVEEGEVCLGAAAAYDANHVQFRVIAKCFQCFDDARFCLVALHLCKSGDDVECEWRFGELCGKIPVGSGPFASDEANAQRHFC